MEHPVEEPDHEEGEISDEDQAWKVQEGTEKPKSPVSSPEKDAPIPQKKCGLIDATSMYQKGGSNSFPRWQGRGLTPGRIEAKGRQHGWGWTGESTFSPQPDHFFQMAWQKGVQGTSKGTAGDSPNEETGLMENFLWDSRGHKGLLSRVHSFRENSFWTDKLGDSNAGAGGALHRSASWAAGSRDFELPVSRKSAEEHGDLMDIGKDDNVISLLSDGREIGEGPRDNEDTPRIGLDKRTITLKSTIEKVDRVASETDDKDDDRKGERNNESTVQESLVSLLEEQPLKITDFAQVYCGDQGNEDREEGELEEGEIEGGSSMQIALSPNMGTAEGMPSIMLQDDKPVDRSLKGREKHSFKGLEKSYSRSDSRERKYRDTGKHRQSTQHNRDRLLAECAELVKNVTVKDAQKSFIGVCRQLRSALKILRDISKHSSHSEGHSRRVSALARQAFAGIRAAYAVRNTASGKEQEQDKDFFPRLLELANGSCQRLFNSKQIRELDFMMQMIGRHSKYDRSQKDHNKDRSLFGAERIEEKDSKLGESSGNTSATTQLETESTAETAVTARTLEFGDEAEQAVNPPAALSSVARPQSLLNTHITSLGVSEANASFGGWFPIISDQFQSWDPSVMDFGKGASSHLTKSHSRELHPSSTGGALLHPSVWTSDLLPPGHRGSQFHEVEFVSDARKLTAGIQSADMPGPSSATVPQEDSGRNRLWPSSMDHLSAVSTYHEKFAGAFPSYTRLPSPTPSEEDDEPGHDQMQPSGNPIDDSVKAQSGIVAQEVQQSAATTALTALRPGLDENLYSTFAVLPAEGKTLKDVESELKLLTNSQTFAIENGDLETSTTTTVSVPVKKYSLKVRDPRRRLINAPLDSEMCQRDLNKLPGNIETQMLMKENFVSEVSRKHRMEEDDAIKEVLGSKRHPQTDSLVSSLHCEPTLASTMAKGGWLGDNTISHVVTEGPTDMEVDGELSRSSGSANTFWESGVKSDKGPDISLKESRNGLGPSKRMKLETAGQEIVESSSTEGFLTVPKDAAAVASKDLKHLLMGDKIPQQNVTNSPRPHVTVDSFTAGGSVKPRMKPRDPRRVLLGTALERAESSGAELMKSDITSVPTLSTSKGGSFLPLQIANKEPEMELSTSTTIESVGSVPQEVLLPNFTHNFTEKLLSLADMMASSQSNLSIGNLSTTSVESKDPLSSMESQIPAEIELTCKSISDDFTRVSKALGSANSKVALTKTPSKKDLNGSAGPPAQRESNNHWDNLEHFLEGLDEKQRQAVRQERARRIDEQNRMLNSRKLCLVLDLDHTLLNSAKFTEVEEEWEARLRTNEVAERNRISNEGVGKRELYRFPHMGMWTKLRPGIWNFLARASQLYELHVYTMGNKAYATEMAKLLDPTGTLFAGRVISKGDDGDCMDGDERPPKSKDLDGVLGMESAVVIIDDSSRVWPHHRHNLIVVERYMYFPCSRRQFGLPGPSLLEVGHDERESDGMLASALAVIDKIHFNFFSNQRLHEVDVRDILAKEQRRVLAGCKIIFSRVFPQGESQPQLHPLWQMAEQFGGVCTTGVDEEITHVVAIALGTDKVNWAIATGRFVVRPAWLEASAILYRRANERDFPVPP